MHQCCQCPRISSFNYAQASSQNEWHQSSPFSPGHSADDARASATAMAPYKPEAQPWGRTTSQARGPLRTHRSRPDTNTQVGFLEQPWVYPIHMVLQSQAGPDCPWGLWWRVQCWRDETSWWAHSRPPAPLLWELLAPTAPQQKLRLYCSVWWCMLLQATTRKFTTSFHCINKVDWYVQDIPGLPLSMWI